MAGKKLGIIITRFENFDHISGIVKAAVAAGHQVQIFMTDEGIRFTTDPKFKELLKVAGVCSSRKTWTRSFPSAIAWRPSTKVSSWGFCPSSRPGEKTWAP